MPKVHFINEIISVDVPHGSILRDVAMDQGVEIYRGMWTHINCRGLGICGRCRIWVLSSKSNISQPRLIRERLMHRVQGDLRLACQVRIFGDVEIRTRPLGPAVMKQVDIERPASYKEAAEQRYVEALEAQAAEAINKAEEAKQKKSEALKANAEKNTLPLDEAVPQEAPAPVKSAEPPVSGNTQETAEQAGEKAKKPVDSLPPPS